MKRITPATYEQLSARLNGSTGSEVGFLELIRSRAYCPLATRPTGSKTHAAIRSYQRILVDLWLSGSWPEALHSPVWSAPVPASWIADIDPADLVPCFLRTDESPDGKIFELQCPGGWWGITQALDEVLRPDRSPTLAERFAAEVNLLFPQGARVLHLFDSAGLPHDSHFFAQRVREASAGIRYRGIDPDIFPDDCNFVRAHSYGMLVAEDLFRMRIGTLRKGRMRFDHPPIPIFDQKMPMCLPFHPSTSALFSDDHRALFPFTTVVTKDGVRVETGETRSLAALAHSPPDERSYFLKYGGMDTTRNFGAKSVYALFTMSSQEILDLFARVVQDLERGEPWLMQAAASHEELVEVIGRDGEAGDSIMTIKLSSFYGPTKPLGMLFLAQSSSAVRGGATTVLSPVATQD